jgi:D-beta-D-heptose 7-phosphate kinase/D-beta-D-heptose 1-phosphate adenosyltransferase
MPLNFSKSPILVVGDLILDKYFHGTVTRISPEAPVPVVLKQYEKTVPGGAANVANNLQKLGARVSLLGIAGSDNNGWLLTSILKEERIDTDIITGLNPTVTKIRIIGEHQQICRLDVEKDIPYDRATRDTLLETLGRMIPKYKMVVISDYDKGLVDRETAAYIIEKASAKGIPVLIDPKKRDWSMYAGATLVTPNLREFREVCQRHQLDEDDLPRSGRGIKQMFSLTNLLITLGEQGMMLITDEEELLVPTVKKEVFDVSGAGDTVIATLAACMAHGHSPAEAVQIANLAAGIVVNKFGTAPVTLEELQEAVQF